MLLLITVLCAQVLANQVAGNKEDIDNSINTACIDAVSYTHLTLPTKRFV